MRVKEFIKEIEKYSGKELLFSYPSNKLVGANYHLTEVKNVQFNTTDCGGKSNFWKETHFQIWESPQEIGKTDYLKVDKILSILKKVDKIKPLMYNTELKIEYGNEDFPTSVMQIEKISINDKKVVVTLFAGTTKCKGNDVCGIQEKEEQSNCCATEVACC